MIELTPAGRQFLNGTERLSLPQLRAVSKDLIKKSSGQTDATGSFDEGLFEQLRRLRKQLANERGVPPFVIFADTALRQMARDFPTDSRGFLNITGVGEQKSLEAFGPAFIGSIADYCQAHNIMPNKDISSVETALPKVTKTASHEETRRMLAEKLSLEAIAEKPWACDGHYFIPFGKTHR